MSKRLVVCCDGTWNTPDQRAPTNVTKFALGIAATGADGREQRVFYTQGVGTRPLQRLRGGAFGFGLSANVRECYRFLVDAFAPGDEIFFVGFSRGAFTARSTAGLVRTCGILRADQRGRIGEAYALYRSRSRSSHPRNIEARLFRRSFAHETPIHFIGVWDTVGSLGIPLSGLRLLNPLNRLWQFHDTDLSTHVHRAHQALAIDERRGPFRPTMWNRQDDAPATQVLEQVWFAGVHSDVGGGYDEPALSDLALVWMADRAAAAGLAFRSDHLSRAQPADDARAEARRTGAWVAPDPVGALHRSRTGIYRLIPEHVRVPGLHPAPGGAPAAGQAIAGSVTARRDAPIGYDPPGLAAAVAAGVPIAPVEGG